MARKAARSLAWTVEGPVRQFGSQLGERLNEVPRQQRAEVLEKLA
jgi:hypothetical protein